MWQGTGVVGGRCGRGHAWQGVCMVGCAWSGACVTGGVHGVMHDRECIMGGVHSMGVCGMGCVWQGYVWQGGMCGKGDVDGRGHAWQGTCMAGETATAADCTQPTGMHSCRNNDIS